MPDGVEENSAAEHGFEAFAVRTDRFEKLDEELGLLERRVFLVEQNDAFGEFHASNGMQRTVLRESEGEKRRVLRCWREERSERRIEEEIHDGRR